MKSNGVNIASMTPSWVIQSLSSPTIRAPWWDAFLDPLFPNIEDIDIAIAFVTLFPNLISVPALARCCA